MTREELIDNMVSCYDNGDAMLEYVEEYYAQRTCESCKYIGGLVELGGGLRTAPFCGFHILNFNTGVNPYMTPDIGAVDYKEASCWKWEAKEE